MIRYLTAVLLSLLSTSAFAGTLLTEKEKSLIPHIDLSFGVTAILASDFEENAQLPATIVFNETLKSGGSMSIIERNGEYAIIVDFLTMFRLKNVSIVTFREGNKLAVVECSSSCFDDMIFGAWDGFISGGSGGGAIGGAMGGAAGWYVAGPPGAAAGAVGGAGVGAAGGGVVGGIIGGVKGSQSCEKEKEAAGCPAE